jgi:branched-chain amino acid aminotransferase
MSVVWLNGRLLPEAQACIPVADRGLLLGDGVFETLRAYGGAPFRAGAHLARLAAGAERLAIPLPGGLDDALAATIAANAGAAGAGGAAGACGAGTGLAVRVTVTRGAGGRGLEPAGEFPPTVLITAAPYVAAAAWYERGLRAVVARHRRNEAGAAAGLKALGAVEAVLARREALAAGADEALVLDTAGHLAEAAAANVFLLVRGRLRTPPLACGILPGITRAAVLELADAAGIEVDAAPVQPAELAQAEELFLTSSLREVVPVVEVGGRPVGAGRPGPVAARLLEAYRRRVREECGG